MIRRPVVELRPSWATQCPAIQTGNLAIDGAKNFGRFEARDAADRRRRLNRCHRPRSLRRRKSMRQL